MTKKAQTKKEFSVSEDKTISFQLAISSAQSKQEYQKVLKKAASSIKIKGFRKGKAPLSLIEKELSFSKIYEDIIQNLIPQIYTDFITKNKLKPIMRPQITLTNPPLTLEKNWVFDIKTCQKPEISLKPYKTDLKKINQKKFKKPEEHNRQIFKLIASKSTIKIPNILIDTQTKEKVSQLVDVASQAGLTLDQYLKNNNTDVKTYQQSLKEEIFNDWRTILSLDKVATDQKIEVKPEELAKVVPSQSSTRQQVDYIHQSLRQQKTIEFLKTIK